MSHPFAKLTPDFVIDCVEALGIPADLRLSALNSYENRVYQVGVEDQDPLIVKFYRPDRWSQAQILEEHAFALELFAAEISIVAPQCIAGQSLHEVNGFLIAVFQRRGGYPPELDNLDHLLVLGRTLGRIHAVGAAQPFSHRDPLPVLSRFEENCEYLAAHWLPDELRAAWSSLAKDLSIAIAERTDDLQAKDAIRLHGDCHVGNILWRDDVPHFIDLDDCAGGPAIQDLWMFLSGDRPQQELQLAELIAGYEEFMDFDARQLHWIETLRTARMVHHAAWIARRWHDPAFPKAFTFFTAPRYWSDQILALREQLALLQEPPLRLL